MKKKKTKGGKIHNQRPFIGYLFLVLLIFYVLYEGGYETFINYNLKQKGICAKAVVYNRYTFGGKGHVSTVYKFVWKNQQYTGKSFNDAKYRQTNRWFKTSDDLVIGDTITVVFMESNPNINRSNSVIHKDCDCE
jgi:hypothetical protein